jgi:hypothetical protein
VLHALVRRVAQHLQATVYISVSVLLIFT